MIVETPYPVITQTPLDPVQWRFLSGRRRDIDVVAAQHPGSVLVFQLRGQYVACVPGKAAASRFGAATAVALVSMQPCTVNVNVMLPSCWADFYVRIDAEYDCKVNDAELVMQSGCFDVRPILRRQFSRDPMIRFGAMTTDPFAFNEFQKWLTARAIARDQVRPLYVPGMVCGLSDLRTRFEHHLAGIEAGAADPAEANGGNGSHGSNGHRRAPQDYIWEEDS